MTNKMYILTYVELKHNLTAKENIVVVHNGFKNVWNTFTFKLYISSDT